ncbi:MAG: ABC transporter permease [Methanomicrobiales archaeon]|nr:ABC transporter permease [Methanomicrobiales archaeon]MDI6876134.1 ABC transporter permease [Methanomicrobiales archaeon]
MGAISSILTIARWEVGRSLAAMSRNVLPVSGVLLLALVLVSGFAAQGGVHLQDGIYRAGVDDPEHYAILAADGRFDVDLAGGDVLLRQRESYDLVVVAGEVLSRDTEKGRAALQALERDYDRYAASVYMQQEDLFAAYPLWVEREYVESELSFPATAGGRIPGASSGRERDPAPEWAVVEVPAPPPTLGFTEAELRSELARGATADDSFERYTQVLSRDRTLEGCTIPALVSPSLPFDTIVLVFVFIFPLYFVSQFCMMSVMNERVERKGEVLLSAPLRPSQIVAGKLLPYLLAMILVSLALILALGAPLSVLLPLLPVMLLFLASALLIGMLSRSFKELSFVSIFFSTIATAYIFFPTVFAHVHAISLISPLTLVVLGLQGEGFGPADYFYATALFYLTGAALLYVGVANFHEERLFGQSGFLSRAREFVDSSLSRERPLASLLLLNILLIPFVFMVQMMELVLFFNLPMPLSLLLLILCAAFTEEVAKSIGLYTLFRREGCGTPVNTLLLACIATALGFLAGEKLLLFAMLAQITHSIFGSILFSSLQVLWWPLLLHLTATGIVAIALKFTGTRGYIPGILLATAVHSLYNLRLIAGWIG